MIRGNGLAKAALVVLACLPQAAWGASSASRYLSMPDEWYGGAEAIQIADNMLSYQSASGGWPKNTNTTAAAYDGDPAELRPSFDNGATCDELRLLARVAAATGEARFERAFYRGWEYILKAQYPNGGWPQFYPPGPQYHRHITFNDGAMVRLMQFLQETAVQDRYRFLGDERRAAAQQAFDRGVSCILKCQIRVNGVLTGWCAQHDEIDFKPCVGRSYELASLSGSESVGVVSLLMSLENPGPEVVAAVEAAVAWFDSVRITGVKVVSKRDPQAPRGFDRVVEPDATAPPCGRDSTILAQIDPSSATATACLAITWPTSATNVAMATPGWAPGPRRC